MKRYHPVSAIILGIFLVGFLSFILPDIPTISNILVIPILIMGGFTATYLSKINKSIYGLYEGLTYVIIGYLPIILLYKTVPLAMIIIMISSPILGFLGGYIAKSLRLHLDNENDQDSNN
jgi:hypothetical protein